MVWEILGWMALGGVVAVALLWLHVVMSWPRP